MDPRATQLIDLLDLSPHPEGGHYRRLFRSPNEVLRAGMARPAMSSIYFLLAEGECSRWHEIALDEVWHFYEGDPLELITFEPGAGALEQATIGPLEAEGVRSAHAIPSGTWQAARPSGRYSLVGCTVAPGFDFSDHRFVSDISGHEEIFNGPLVAYRFLL